MTPDQVARAVALGVALASAETLHDIARTVLVVPRIGKERALRWSALTGSLLAFAICAALVPGLGLFGWAAHLALGLGLAVFMAAFDIAIGRFVMRLKWPRILRDFNPASGNYLLFGLIVLSVAPLVVAAWTGRLAPGG